MDRQSRYTELLKRHLPMVWRGCWVRARGNYERCRDLVQEVSIALWLHLDQLRTDVSPKEEQAWVWWMTRTTLDHLHRSQRPPMVALTEVMAETIPDADNSAVEEDIEELMAALSPEERQLMRLHIEGYRADEIAKTLGLRRDTVYQRMHRALGKARKALLVLFLLLVASTVAIAVVPSWRQRVFSSGEPAAEDTVPVSVSAPVSAVVKEDVDSVPSLEVVAAPEAREVQPPVEHINFSTEPLISFDEPPILPSDRQLRPATIAITGTILTVSGLDGEWVVFYDKYGRVVSSKCCRGMCTFEIPSKLGRFYGVYQYNLAVGDTLWIKMRI